ncbi:hypothetical protein RC083_16110 [Pseudoalteromonas haloplanktis]|uniref:Uncharacterized protein n=1 Tax=Pseudoalteromonas haloplanktis TaxID=228 RepID=A0ABU1BHN2_PSEHA|nr:hypothetical protein [Pseudoalteromonas haloplanktis]MDQ9093102.1 hypothetical protein [Pseudoalteromonas haloplanktis]
MKQQTGLTFKQRNKLNTIYLAKWTLGWVLTLALASIGPGSLWAETNTLFSIVAVIINICAGIMMIMANKRHLSGLDELQQRLHLNAMAITLGGSLVFGLAYSVLQTSGSFRYDKVFLT